MDRFIIDRLITILIHHIIERVTDSKHHRFIKSQRENTSDRRRLNSSSIHLNIIMLESSACASCTGWGGQPPAHPHPHVLALFSALLVRPCLLRATGRPPVPPCLPLRRLLARAPRVPTGQATGPTLACSSGRSPPCARRGGRPYARREGRPRGGKPCARSS